MSGTQTPTPTPATVAVSPQQLGAFQRAANALDKLLGDPKLGRQVRATVKEAMPDVDFSKFTAQEQMEDAIAAATKTLTDKVAELEAKQAERDKKADEDKQFADFSTRVTAAVKQHRLTDEGMQKMIERMKEQQSSDVEAAAAWVAEQAPKPQSPQPSNIFPGKVDAWGTQSKDPQFEKLHKDPMGYLDDVVRETLSDPALAA